MLGKLYIVATPIGNLDDISKRALDTLKTCNLVICEDTRVTKRIFNKYNISNKLIVLNDINEIKKKNQILELLLNGLNIALVSDAGTPCISDPGYRLVNLSTKHDIDVITIPGPCSVSAALSICGLPTDCYYFQGFLPKKKGRETKFKKLVNVDCTVVLFESPKRIVKTLNDIQKYMGNRVVSLCRELTKIYEEVTVNSVDNILADSNSIKLKGEYVIIIAKEDYKY